MSECRVVDLKELGISKELFDCIYSMGEQDGISDAIDEIVKLMKPCNNCPSYPNECNDTDYFEDCCRTEQSISWEDLRLKAEQLKQEHFDNADKKIDEQKCVSVDDCKSKCKNYGDICYECDRIMNDCYEE